MVALQRVVSRLRLDRLQAMYVLWAALLGTGAGSMYFKAKAKNFSRHFKF